jgi:hypothetical protein
MCLHIRTEVSLTITPAKLKATEAKPPWHTSSCLNSDF